MGTEVSRKGALSIPPAPAEGPDTGEAPNDNTTLMGLQKRVCVCACMLVCACVHMRAHV